MIGAEELICNEGSPVKTGWIGMEVSSIPIILIYLELSEKFWFCVLITPIVCSMPFFTEHGCGKGRDLKKRMKRCFRVQRALRLVCRVGSSSSFVVAVPFYAESMENYIHMKEQRKLAVCSFPPLLQGHIWQNRLVI